MATITAKHFDTLEFVQISKELGVPEKIAEYQARKIEQAIEIAIVTVKDEIKYQDLATKTDIQQEIKVLELKIAETKNQIIIWVGGLIIASGLVQHFFK